MSNPILIEYASEVLEQPAERFLRRIVAWTAIVNGGMEVLGMALRLALTKGWLASPQNTLWFEGRWQMVLASLSTANNAALLCGGLRLLYRWRWSVIILRASAIFSIALSAINVVMYAHLYPSNYPFSPGATALYVLRFLGGQWVPVLILLLTLPRLARRMV